MKYNLEGRLVDFAVSIIKISNELNHSFAAVHLSKQLIRSGTSIPLNYGEAQSAESRKEFIYKMKISLKEARESMVCLKILERAHLIRKKDMVEEAKKELNEITSILVTSIATAQRNLHAKN